MSDNKIFHDLADLRNEFFRAGVRLQKSLGWTEKDVRIGIFAKCMNVIEPVLFSLDFCDMTLRTPEYQAKFSKDHKTPPEPEEMQHQVDNYIRFQQFSYAELLFSAIESSLRVIVRGIDPKACNEGRASFSSVYDYLLKKTGLEKYKPLLDLFREIRNTVHNNGIYLPERNGNKTIEWKGETYNFEVGKQISFVTLPFLIEISKDLREMIEKIVETEPVVSLKPLDDPTFPEGEELRELHGDI